MLIRTHLAITVFAIVLFWPIVNNPIIFSRFPVVSYAARMDTFFCSRSSLNCAGVSGGGGVAVKLKPAIRRFISFLRPGVGFFKITMGMCIHFSKYGGEGVWGVFSRYTPQNCQTIHLPEDSARGI